MAFYLANMEMLNWPLQVCMCGKLQYQLIVKGATCCATSRRLALLEGFWAMILNGTVPLMRHWCGVLGHVEGRFMIKFGRYISVQERNVAGDVEFPFYTFALTPIANLPRPTDLLERFTDVPGFITGISKVAQFHNASHAEPSTKRIIYLSDFLIVLWGERVTAFDGYWVVTTAQKSPVIVIFVGTLVKGYNGRKGLIGSAACRWYINDDLPEINEIQRRLKNKIHVVENIMLPGQTADEISAQVNLETKTVDELLALNIYNNEDTADDPESAKEPLPVEPLPVEPLPLPTEKRWA
ncbi:hypothetical protein ACQ4PT_059200 [Festuca glaucescens]